MSVILIDHNGNEWSSDGYGNHNFLATDYKSIFEKHAKIEKVIFNNPATIVFWDDGTKTVVKCMEGDTFSKEMGLAMCICKKFLGNDFHKTFREWADYGVRSETVSETIARGLRKAIVETFRW